VTRLIVKQTIINEYLAALGTYIQDFHVIIGFTANKFVMKHNTN